MKNELLSKISMQLRALADEVEKSTSLQKIEIEIPFQGIIAGLPNADLKTIIQNQKEYKKSKYLYILEAGEEADIQKCYEAYKKAKNNKNNNRAYARLNDPSPIFYVGTSQSLPARLKQHLGYATAGIYSIQLKHWLSNMDGSLKISALRYPPDIDQNVLQAIEDGVWREKAPMFGRQGAR